MTTLRNNRGEQIMHQTDWKQPQLNILPSTVDGPGRPQRERKGESVPSEDRDSIKDHHTHWTGGKQY